MFDLFRSRDKAVRIFLTALLSLVALSMVAYLIPGYGGSGAPSSNDTVIAEVGKQKVTIHDVQLAVRAATRNRDMPPQMMAHYVPQMIDQMINEKALIYQANKMGLQVTEAETAKAIREQMPHLFPNGTFVGKEAYAAALAQQDMSIAAFEEYMQEQILLNRLRSVVLENTVVSKTDIEREFRLKNEKATIEYVKIDPQKIQAEVKVSPEEMSSYFEKNKGQYRTPDRVKTRHILLMTTGKSPEEEAKIKVKAEDLLKQVKAGGNFA